MDQGYEGGTIFLLFWFHDVPCISRLLALHVLPLWLTCLRAGVIAKLVDKNVAIDVHQPEKPNPFLRTLGDVAFPLLTIAGIRAATYNAGICW